MSAPATAQPRELAAQHCTFWVDGLFLGVAVHDVQEVLRYQDMTAVPKAPPSVHGLINLRGQIVTALDLRCRLGFAPRPPGDLPMNVVLRSRDEVLSLLVDDIGDVIDTSGLVLEPVPVTVPLELRRVLRGVLSVSDSILLVLDPDQAADLSPDPIPQGVDR